MKSKVEVLARELCFIYRRGRRDENLSYCRLVTSEQYIEENWHQFKGQATELLKTMSRYEL